MYEKTVSETLISMAKNYICCGNCSRHNIVNVCGKYNKNPKENDVCVNHSFDFKTFDERIIR